MKKPSVDHRTPTLESRRQAYLDGITCALTAAEIKEFKEERKRIREFKKEHRRREQVKMDTTMASYTELLIRLAKVLTDANYAATRQQVEFFDDVLGKMMHYRIMGAKFGPALEKALQEIRKNTTLGSVRPRSGQFH